MHWWVKYFNFQDVRSYWVFFVLISVYTYFWIVNEPSLTLVSLVAVLACVIPLKVVRYDFLSFITISAIGHAIAYPLAALLTLGLPIPAEAVERVFLETTSYAMWACVVGMLGLATGASLINKFNKRYPRTGALGGAQWIPSAGKNLVLVLIILPVVAFYMYAGFYYHSGVTGIEKYNFEAAKIFGFVGYFTHLAYAGVVLQIRRYTITQAKSDGIAALMYILILLVVFIPSGSRVQALVVIPLALITFMAWEKRTAKKGIMIIIAVALFIVIGVSMEFYRNKANFTGAYSIGQQIKVLANINVFNPETDSYNPNVSRIILARRMADYIAPGYLISIIPSGYPYRWFEDVDKWIIFLLPTLIRPDTDFSFADGAGVCFRYGIRATPGAGSSPVMILGDLYSRFGWPGIFFGMMLIGMLFRWLDFRLRRWRVFDIILFTFLFQQVITLLNESLLRHFVYFTRSLLIILVISAVTTKVLRGFSRGGYRFRRKPNVLTDIYE